MVKEKVHVEDGQRTGREGLADPVAGEAVALVDDRCVTEPVQGEGGGAAGGAGPDDGDGRSVHECFLHDSVDLMALMRLGTR
ncbi:hypothetical protein Srubr_29020 [Streptomyces rubradiris]|uniref:Uncharacterized protein n=1 Tax=Streptomyces rubradiris TaxID=285531 RepID=A0ABQ3RB23_STRRR|nr:hypothetical protein GCM10018792_51900 [Streptomyces rubradiris]GHI53056.1 hypothetical protein Srubr_29020 [Streptomyces rubradiris]